MNPPMRRVIGTSRQGDVSSTGEPLGPVKLLLSCGHSVEGDTKAFEVLCEPCLRHPLNCKNYLAPKKCDPAVVEITARTSSSGEPIWIDPIKADRTVKEICPGCENFQAKGNK